MDYQASMYSDYILPSWAPPAWVFGPVWTVLYITIAIGFFFIFRGVLKGDLPRWLGIAAIVNLISNFLFTPIQFGLQNLPLAWVDIMIVFTSLYWIEVGLWNRLRWVFWLLLPYTLWVTFATILQSTVTVLNI